MAESGGTAAGAGAREQAAKAAASVADAERRLAAAQRRQRAWEAGAEGERRTGEALKTLEPHGWRLLHDLHWPGRPFANIDHIAVGPGGVFVIDSKNWSGRIEVREGVLRQNGYRRTEACDGAAAAAVAALVAPEHRTAVRALMCLVGQPTPSQQPGQFGVYGLEDLSAQLRGQPQRLTSQDVSLIMARLQSLLSGERRPSQMTTAALTHSGPGPAEIRGSTPNRRGRARGAQTTPAQRPRQDFRRGGRAAPGKGRSNPAVMGLKLTAVAFLALVLLPAFMRGIDKQRPVDPASPSPLSYKTPSTAHS